MLAADIPEADVLEGLRALDDPNPEASLAAGRQIVEEAKRAGHMYEVNIAANPDDFLDWDRPLSEQSEKVRGAVSSRMQPPDAFKGPARTRAEAAATGDFSDIDGHSALTLLGGYGDPSKASTALREAGIPGIRYLDQGSRTAGDGSRNYVVFDENLINIMRKYAMLGGLTGLGGLAAMQPDSEPQY
jgi:hypothetical protein